MNKNHQDNRVEETFSMQLDGSFVTLIDLRNPSLYIFYHINDKWNDVSFQIYIHTLVNYECTIQNKENVSIKDIKTFERKLQLVNI